MSNESLRFKLATSPEEYDQIYQLNYATFVEEIPQHEPNEHRRLVDAMLDKSDCFICLEGDRLIGMVAVSGERPFSLDRKIENLDQYLPRGYRPCEGRLLAVKPSHRSGRVFVGLIRRLWRYCDDNGYDMAVFSATETQWPMYLHGGCVPFGPLLGTEAARFQAMYITRDRLTKSVRRLLNEARSGGAGETPGEADERSVPV